MRVVLTCLECVARFGLDDSRFQNWDVSHFMERWQPCPRCGSKATRVEEVEALADAQ